MKKFIEELKRRNVIKAAIAYLVFAWLLLQVFTVLLPIFNAPDWILRVFTIVLAIGLPIWVIISWMYDITPEGVEKTSAISGGELVNQATNKRLNIFIITGLSIAVIVLAINLSFSSDKPDNGYSLAVIPFSNLKVDQDKIWLSQNFTQNVNTYLSKVKNLKVIDFYSTSRYDGTDKTNSEIGKELDVAYILRGTLTQLKDKLTVVVELIEVKSNSVDWSEQYDAILEDDPLKTQQDISQKLVTHLKVALSPENEKTLNTLLSTNQEANIYFNEGLRIANSRTPTNGPIIFPRSTNLFQKAIDLDPMYADAYAYMAFILRLLRDDHMYFKNTNKFKKIDSLLNKALEIDPKNAIAYTTMGMMLMDESKYDEAKVYYDKALSIKPNDASIHHYLGIYYKTKPEADSDKAVEHYKIANRLNPLSVPISASLIIGLLDIGEIKEAETLYKNRPLPQEEMLEQLIFDAKIKKETNEMKDWGVAIDRYHEAIKKDSLDSYLYRQLAKAYNEVLYDHGSYLKYAQKAYELGRLYSENQDWGFMSSNGEEYFLALLNNNKFQEAENLLKDDYFKSLFASPYLDYLLFDLYYYQEKYNQAKEVIPRMLPFSPNFELLKFYSQLGHEQKVDSIFKAIDPKLFEKAIIFAILERRDSMYHYLNNDRIDFRPINGSSTFDPYRKEERFKALLKKHFLPLTHWNK